MLFILSAGQFLSTPSARRATWGGVLKEAARKLFLSTPSARRATTSSGFPKWSKIVYFYPRPPRGGRLPPCAPSVPHQQISIHALREEGDRRRSAFLPQLRNFYPRPPRGGRLDRLHKALNNMAFLSTPSARRATPVTMAEPMMPCHFYPRPPRGGRRWYGERTSTLEVFLSTPSVRRATQAGEVHRYGRPISIHALREEGDGKLADEVIIVREFLSTPSARRATLCASALA